MSKEAFSSLLRDIARIERLIEEAEGRASDAAAALDDRVVRRTALELSQFRRILLALKEELATRAGKRYNPDLLRLNSAPP